MDWRVESVQTQEEELDILRSALDAMDVGVVVLRPDLRTRLYANSAAAPVLSHIAVERLNEAIDAYVQARRDLPRMPPARRVSFGEQTYYLRVVPSNGAARLEVVFLRQEVLRDIEVLRILEERFQITRREYQIVTALRLGKTNRQIANELGLAEGSVAGHVHRLLERMGVRNRTALVHLVDEIVRHR